MKKSLIALAALAAAGAASAQSSVTLFGIVDAAVSRYSVSGGSHVNALSNSGYNSSRLGFRGTEDLGGGLSASFWLEGALQNDSGYGSGQNTSGSTSTGFDFRRRSTVSLAGGWGELRLGRDYVPTFWNITVFDPFGTNGVGSALTHKVKLANGSVGALAPGYAPVVDGNYVRASNMVQYFLPANMGGFYGQVSYAFDELSFSDAGRYWGGRIGFASGPFNVAAAYGHTDGGTTSGAGAGTTTGYPAVTPGVFPANATLGTSPIPDVRDWNIGGQWDFGMLKLLGSYDNARYSGDVGGTDRLKSYTLGVLVPVGAGEIRASYSRAKLDTAANDPRSTQYAIGYVHNLSKRTAVYATFAHLTNRDGADLPVNASIGYTGSATSLAGIAGRSSNGFDLGIRHSF
jgi:predicted porin